MLQRIRFAACLLTAATFLGAAGDTSNPFLGKWEIDKKKTKATGAPEQLQMEIRKSGDNGLLIKSKYQEPRNAIYPLLWIGIMTYELPLSADGSEKQNQIGPFMHVSKTVLEGTTMTTDWTAKADNTDVQGKWIRTLSPDGKEMNLEIVAKASDGRNMDQILVFRRK